MERESKISENAIGKDPKHQECTSNACKGTYRIWDCPEAIAQEAIIQTLWILWPILRYQTVQKLTKCPGNTSSCHTWREDVRFGSEVPQDILCRSILRFLIAFATGHRLLWLALNRFFLFFAILVLHPGFVFWDYQWTRFRMASWLKEIDKTRSVQASSSVCGPYLCQEVVSIGRIRRCQNCCTVQCHNICPSQLCFQSVTGIRRSSQRTLGSRSRWVFQKRNLLNRMSVREKQNSVYITKGQRSV